METDTIAAIATAMTNSGIGIVRISGEQSFQIIDKIYRSKKSKKKLSEAKSHTIHYGYICDGEKVIDEVVALIFKAPNSYTMEDTVEIDCHGGILVMRRILETVIKYGARPAEPGEFTKRAFLNGRIDLSQAESVADLINAKNDFALESSVHQLQGSIKEKVKEARKIILHEIAFIESALDDPEHISLDGYGGQLMDVIDALSLELTNLIRSSENGELLKEGINTVIAGKPNAGKSSLMNALTGKERAIVTEVAGTTRDILEGQVNLDGVTLNLIDTAGIHEAQDAVEKIGIEKARDSLERADLVIFVVDASTEFDKDDKEVLSLLGHKKVIFLLNKSDLVQVTTEKKIRSLIKQKGMACPVIAVSAKEGTGIDELSRQIKEMFFEGEVSFNDQVFITNVRQKSALLSAIDSLSMVKDSISDGMPEDFYSIDLIEACNALGKITGETVGEDLVNEIFSKFCLGK